MKLFTPIEIAKMFGVSAGTIRGYESKGVVPKRLPSGYRKYTIENIREFIKLFGYEPTNYDKIINE